jgi:hypothetical protein
MEPRVEDAHNEASDAEKGLVLAARQLSESEIVVLKCYPICMEQSVEERVGAESELRLKQYEMGSFGRWWEWFLACVLA